MVFTEVSRVSHGVEAGGELGRKNSVWPFQGGGGLPKNARETNLNHPHLCESMNPSFILKKYAY